MNYLLIFLLTWTQPSTWFHHKPSPTPTAAPTATPRHRTRHARTDSPTPSPASAKTPRGIFYLLKTDEPISEKQPCWKNPAVNGVRLSVSLGSIEKSKGELDWAQLEAAAALAKANGKQWSVGVIWSPNTPDWLGAKNYALSTGSAPLPWDPAMIAAELDFIRAFGEHFAADPNLAAVVIGGLGTGSDGFSTTVAKEAGDVTAIGSAGGATEWIAATKQIIAAYAAAFPHTAIIVAVGDPFPNDNKSLAAIGDWATDAYPGFGVMSCNLQMTSAVDDTPTALVNAYALSHPCGFQLLTASSERVRLGGTLPKVLEVGVQLLRGRGEIEVYPADCDDSANADALTKTAGQLGFVGATKKKSKEED